MGETRDQNCKSCLTDARVTDEQIQRTLAVLQLKGFDCVPEPVYQKRLAACSTCFSLHQQHTCKHCGCIVQVRARLADKNCPYPGQSKWDEVVKVDE
jgi:hypothetical protein